MKRKYNSEDSKDKSIDGVVTSHKYDCCGHHEIGIITEDGKYISLKPGMKVKIIKEG